MRKHPDLFGQQFGRLTVLEKVEGSSPCRWRCRCSCGKEVTPRAGHLVAGHTRSCGCLQKEIAAAITVLRPYEALYNRFVHNNKNKWAVSISYKEFVEFTSILECHYCGNPVSWSKYHPKKNGRGYNLDRKDSSKGYFLNNVVVCCWRCNQAKSNDFTYEEWLFVGRALRQYREGSWLTFKSQN